MAGSSRVHPYVNADDAATIDERRTRVIARSLIEL